MEKMTNVKALEYVMANCELPTDVAEKLGKMKEQFVKKNSADRKPTANQTENAGLKVAILGGLATGKLKDEGAVTREEIKRKAYFTKAVADEEVDLSDEE